MGLVECDEIWPLCEKDIRCKIPEVRKAETDALSPKTYYKSRSLNPYRCWIETLTRNSSYEFRLDNFWECKRFTTFCWKNFLSALYIFGVPDLNFKKFSMFKGLLIFEKGKLNSMKILFFLESVSLVRVCFRGKTEFSPSSVNNHATFR